mmetsp:Transcript_85296/g.183984  ORF Transcript_85296/g.183984 Transcript_85296/m.183984 type:complete len:206 (+) Transcript_85296:1006-1623(+)
MSQGRQPRQGRDGLQDGCGDPRKAMGRRHHQGEQASRLLCGAGRHCGLQQIRRRPRLRKAARRRDAAHLLLRPQVPPGLGDHQKGSLLPSLLRHGHVAHGGVGVRTSRRAPGLGAEPPRSERHLGHAQRGLGLGWPQPHRRLHGLVRRHPDKFHHERKGLGLRRLQQEWRLWRARPRWQARRQHVRRQAPLRVLRQGHGDSARQR